MKKSVVVISCMSEDYDDESGVPEVRPLVHELPTYSFVDTRIV